MVKTLTDEQMKQYIASAKKGATFGGWLLLAFFTLAYVTAMFGMATAIKCMATLW